MKEMTNHLFQSYKKHYFDFQSKVGNHIVFSLRLLKSSPLGIFVVLLPSRYFLFSRIDLGLKLLRLGDRSTVPREVFEIC